MRNLLARCRGRALAAVAALAALALGCGGIGGGGGGDDGGDDEPGARGVFDRGITRVRVEIDYEAGKAPYTGNVVGFGDTFDLTINNLDRLFAGTKELDVPRTTAAMENVGAIPDDELTVAELLALAREHRDLADTADTRTYYVLFVGGFFHDGDGPRQSVLGVSIGDTGVIAMFKDVIESTGLPALPNLARFVEQTTLVHELGHALGLVANGVPTTSAHHDAEHGAHCTSRSCVMYWLNEGASDMVAFVRDRVTRGDVIVFDGACLADVDALTGGP